MNPWVTVGPLTAALDRWCRGRVLLPVVAIWIAASVGLFLFGPYRAVRQAGGAPLLDERFGYSAVEGQQYLEALGDAGRTAYAGFLGLDLLVMVLLGGTGLVLLVGWLRRWLAPGAARWDLLVMLPIAMSLCDAIENAAILRAIADPATASVTLGPAGGFTMAKHGLGRVSMLGLAAGFGWLGIVRLGGRRPG